MAKNNKPASSYAGRAKEGLKHNEEYSYKSGADCMNRMNISVAGISKGNYEPVEKEGIKIRGTGAATKGVKARGPMA